ncbi:MAG: hypothetical protein WC250_02140 [Candidatus Paceibacterota bacterium]|jgi:hypothetical protein
MNAIVIVTTNMRAGFGEAAKEGIVGVYQVPNESRFRKVASRVGDRISRRKWQAPGDRAHAIREGLMREGFIPLATGAPCFVSVF